MEFSVRTIRLDSNPREGGLWCGPEGLTLAGHPLLKKTDSGFVPASLPELQMTFDRAFGEDPHHDVGIYVPGLASIARSLNKDDLPLAMIGSLLLKLPDLPQAAPERKLAFDDTQPRDGNGRWTNGGSEAKSPFAIQAEATAGAEGATAARLAPRIVMLLGRLARILPGPVALAAGVLIPTNDSNIHSGEFPGFEGLHYRSDEGVVTISRLDAAGNIETLYHGFPNAEGFYHDNQGEIIGQQVGTGVMFDNEALASLSTKKPDQPETQAVSAPATEFASAIDDEEPRVCPPETKEDIKGRSDRSLLYQQQITGLPIGYDMLYRGVRFDGCDASTQFMQEAKGLMGGYLTVLSDDQIRGRDFYSATMRQAGRQNDVAADRGVDWYFADKRFADFFEEEFRRAKYTHIIVHYREANVKKQEISVTSTEENLADWRPLWRKNAREYLLAIREGGFP